ncbi:5'-nucleotidase [Saccharothrix syringae]|nr:5'-nucleotidase [Saccharothrix syringae]
MPITRAIFQQDHLEPASALPCVHVPFGIANR